MNINKPGKITLIDPDATYETLMARLTAVVDRLDPDHALREEHGSDAAP